MTIKRLTQNNVELYCEQVNEMIMRKAVATDYDALAIPGGFEEFGFYEEAFSEEMVWVCFLE